MEYGYLARESEGVNKTTRKMFIKLMSVFICALAIIYFLGKDSINFEDISYGSVSFYLIIIIGLVLICIVIKLVATGRTASNGDNYFSLIRITHSKRRAGLLTGRLLRGKSL